MKYIVIKDYRTDVLKPIELVKGEKVFLGEESKTTWPDWILCTKADRSNEGWVPKQIIKKNEDHGEILEDYTAKELNIDEGTTVEGIKELNGWLWLKNKNTDEIGWVPLDNLKKLLHEE